MGTACTTHSWVSTEEAGLLRHHNSACPPLSFHFKVIRHQSPVQNLRDCKASSLGKNAGWARKQLWRAISILWVRPMRPFQVKKNHPASCSRLAVKAGPDPEPQTTTTEPLYGAALLLNVHFTTCRPQILKHFLGIRPAEIRGNAALGFCSLNLVRWPISKSEGNTTSCWLGLEESSSPH